MFFGNLSLGTVPALKDIGVETPRGVGVKDIARGRLDGEVVLGGLPSVEITRAPDVHVTHVVTVDISDLLARLLDLALEVVLGLLLHRPELVETVQIIPFVKVLNFPRDLVAHCSHKDVVELVAAVRKPDRVAVLKRQHFVAFHYQGSGVQPGFSLPACPAV